MSNIFLIAEVIQQITEHGKGNNINNYFILPAMSVEEATLLSASEISCFVAPVEIDCC
jgi:hypothetical protein